MHRESCVYWVGLQGILSLTDQEHIPVIESIPISFISTEQNKSATSIPLISFYYTFNVKRASLELYCTELYMIRPLTHRCQKTTLLPANYV